MRLQLALIGISLAAVFGLLAVPVSRAAVTDEAKSLAIAAVGEDADTASAAIAKLRAMGPAGLQAMFETHSDAINIHIANPQADRANGAWCRLSTAIDHVAAQKDAWSSRLYWYTDFDAAQSAAREAGKPILSLRLLGVLDTEFSCANSRFFRTALYANREVSAALREKYILHWKSVRPVPKVTIDFGDGRVVERTITGNSIHYVLDADGNVVDAMPGLYGPKAFLARVDEAAVVEKGTRKLPPDQRAEFRRNWHEGKSAEILTLWQRDLRAAGVTVPAMTEAAAPSALIVNTVEPTALMAAPRAVGKTMAERPLVRVLTAPQGERVASASPAVRFTPPAFQAAAGQPLPAAIAGSGTPKGLTFAADVRTLEAATDDEAWKKIAALHAGEANLDEGSRAMIVSKVTPTAAAAGRLSIGKGKVEDPLVRVVNNFQRAMAEDSVRNEYTFHRTIHTWLASRSGAAEAKLVANVDQLNEKVYAELFLTPSSDPWLGLLPADAYSALENDGMRK